MHVAVIGAGAIGGVLATAAADSGHDVTLCVRTAIDRLVLFRDAEELTPALTVASTPSGVGAADVVWLTSKTTDIPGTAPWLEYLCSPSTVVAAAQNGLDHEAHLAPYLRAGRVVPALAYMAAERLGPGRVRHISGNQVVVPAAEESLLARAVGAGGIEIRGVVDMKTALWRKLLGNLVANPMTALTMRRIGVMREPGIAELARGILLEAVQVGRAEGADLRDEYIEAIVVGTGRYGERTGSSMLYDRLAGRPLEHQFLTGEVVRRAAAHGIPVPLNSGILALLDALDRGQRKGDA
jgi:2-dehydropantoate 2-reductase